MKIENITEDDVFIHNYSDSRWKITSSRVEVNPVHYITVTWDDWDITEYSQESYDDLIEDGNISLESKI